MIRESWYECFGGLSSDFSRIELRITIAVDVYLKSLVLKYYLYSKKYFIWL
jgi:hypothetical protein